MSIILLPSNGPESWRTFLGDPIKHWRTGYSAKALAHCWEEADGFPKSIQSLLTSLDDPDLTNIHPLLAIPEHKVPLPSGGNPSQNDVFVLARSDTALISICVEGKVNESFDKTVAEWGPDSTPGKRARSITWLTSSDSPARTSVNSATNSSTAQPRPLSKPSASTPQ